LINIKKSGRFSFRPNKRHSYSRNNSSFVSNRPRSKGGIVQMYDKYIKLAKESFSVGDRIQAEYYNQFADHYSRIMTDNGIKSSENENVSEKSKEKYVENSSEDSNHNSNKLLNENNSKIAEKDDKLKEIDENDNSLETVSFISKPAKKTSKLKK